ncbi:MAG TPA: biopolymer transporter ExbD, partial [Caldimonas sp.]
LLKLEVVIRPEALEVGDRIGGLFWRIPNVATGADVKTLSARIEEVKLKYPETREATVLSEPSTSYDTLVQVMDAVRSGHQAQGAKIVSTDFFPNISIGDAPVRRQ